MPTNLMLADSQFPRIDRGEDTEQAIFKLQNYLYMLVEQLRYSLHNLDVSNLNQAAWDEMKLEIQKPIYVRLENSTGGTTELEATVAGLKATVERHDKSIGEFQVTADSLSASVESLTTGMKQTLYVDPNTGFIFSNQTGKMVTIDGGQISADTVSAGTLVGQTVNLRWGPNGISGSLSLTAATTGAEAVQLYSNAAMRFVARSGALWMQSSGTRLCLAPNENAILFYSGGYPDADGVYNLGTSDKKWSTVYATNGVKTTSDRREKRDIEALPGKYIDLFDRMDVCRYRMNRDPAGPFHVGFVAQDVEAAMGESGIDAMEFGGLCKEKSTDGRDIYMLRYEEFIGILAAKIKQLGAKLSELEGKI